jgi:hypothetical protein
MEKQKEKENISLEEKFNTLQDSNKKNLDYQYQLWIKQSCQYLALHKYSWRKLSGPESGGFGSSWGWGS